MKPTQQLHNLGQSLWLDNITRALLTSGTLRGYIDDLSVTGLTSNPSIFDAAIKDSNLYDDAIRQKTKEGKAGEIPFFELAIDDLRQAADLFRPVHDSTGGVDGWVSLEVSPLLAYDAASTVKEAVHSTLGRNAPISSSKFPGPTKGELRLRTPSSQGCQSTLPFYSRAAITSLLPKRTCVGSSGGSPWGSIRKCAPWHRYLSAAGTKLSWGRSRRTFKTAWALPSRSALTKRTGISSLRPAGKKPLLPALSHSACSGRALAQKDPDASDVLYIRALGAPDTINTIPEATLLAFANHGAPGDPMPLDGGDAEKVIGAFVKAGIDDEQLAADLQREGAESFVKSWTDLLDRIGSKHVVLKAGG